MGLFAVARLAERHRVRVRLRSAAPQGLSALVWLPDGVVERTSIYGGVGGWQSQYVGGTGAQPAAGGRQLGGMHEGVVALAPNDIGNGNGSHAEGPRVAKGWFRGRGGASEGSPAGVGAAPDWRAARGESFDQTSTGLPVRTPRVSANSDTGTDAQAGLPGWADSARGGPAPNTGIAPDWSVPRTGSFDQTSTGLPVRTPRVSANSDTGTDPQAGLPGWADSARGGPLAGSGTRTGSQPLPQRSADQVRSRLAGFQRGTRRAESEQGPSPRAGEGSER
jgi:hypothetical protein